MFFNISQEQLLSALSYLTECKESSLLNENLKVDSHLPKKIVYEWKPFTNDEKCFLFYLKNSFVLKIFKFFPWLFGQVKKRLDQKDKLDIKIYDVTIWLINNDNIHIAQYLSKKWQPNNEIGSVSRL